MSDDTVIAVLEDGRKIYDNAFSVAVAAIGIDRGEHKGKIVAIRRNNEPGKGKIALPGGFQMRGQSYVEAASRELHEETGILIKPRDLQFLKIDIGANNVNLIFCCQRLDVHVDLSTIKAEESEVQEVLLLDQRACIEAGWAFPTHEVVARFITGSIW